MEVRVSAGLTINLGDMQFAKIVVELEKEFSEDFGVTVAIDEVYNIVEDATIEKVDKLINRTEREGLL